MPETSDVTSTLAELERKLRELEQELTSLGRRPTPAQATPSAWPATPPQSIAPPSSAPPMATPSAWRARPARSTTPPTDTPPWQSPAPPQQPPASQPTWELGGRLIDEAAEIPEQVAPPERRATPEYAPAPGSAPSDAQLAGLAELRRFGSRLEQFGRELAEDYEQVLERALIQLAPGPPPAPGPEDILLEGHVELGVGPFYDIGSLSSFEQHVAALPHTSDVAVRRFEASHAVLDLQLDSPVALVRELRAALGIDLSVREIGNGRLMLTFDDV